MNGLFGSTGSDGYDDRSGKAWFDQVYRQYLRQTDVLVPGMTWVMVDEHPDSINDTFFINTPNQTSWADIPASSHNGAGSISFVDGHVEIHRWTSTTSVYPVRFSYGPVRGFDAAGRLDWQWYKDRTGFLLYR